MADQNVARCYHGTLVAGVAQSVGLASTRSNVIVRNSSATPIYIQYAVDVGPGGNLESNIPVPTVAGVDTDAIAPMSDYMIPELVRGTFVVRLICAAAADFSVMGQK